MVSESCVRANVDTALLSQRFVYPEPTALCWHGEMLPPAQELKIHAGLPWTAVITVSFSAILVSIQVK